MIRYLFVLWLLSPGLAAAKPFVCFTGDKIASSSLFELTGNSDGAYGQPIFENAAWNPSCEAIQKTVVGLNATSIVLSGAGWGLACTGIGVSATVWLQGAALGTRALGLIVGELPCDASASEAEVKRLAKDVVCQELAKQNIGCSL